MEALPEPEPPEPEPPVPEPPVPEPPAPPTADPPERLVPAPLARPPRRVNTGLLAAWLLSMAVLGVASWAAYTYRGDIMRAWPPSERAYAVLGLAPVR